MTASTPPNNPKRAVLRHLRPSDLRAAAQLASQATQGVINITEGVHQSVRRRLGFSSGASDEQASGLTGQIYRGVRGVAHIVGHGLDGALATLLPLVDDPATHPEASPAREAVLAALKVQLGEQASPHLLLLIHGLSMNDTQWRRSGHDHGEVLAQALGCTPVY